MTARTLVRPSARPHTCPSWATACSADGRGDSVFHESRRHEVPVPDDRARQGRPSVSVAGVDDPDQPVSPTVDLLIGDASSVCLTADEALTLADLLRDQALALAGEQGLIVPVTQVRIGDLFRKDGDWLPVYCIDLDEASYSAQVFTTVDPETYPETDGDEVSQRFDLDASVRVRRAAVTP